MTKNAHEGTAKLKEKNSSAKAESRKTAEKVEAMKPDEKTTLEGKASAKATKPKETKLLSPKLDFVFSSIFGDPKNIDLLAALLKSILDIPDEEYERLEIVNPFSFRTYLEEKQIVLDIKVHTVSGKVIDVEIQRHNKPAFAERVCYYASKLLTEQLERGNEYDTLRNVICIAILDFAMFKDEPAYRNAFHLRNDRSGRVFSDIVEINTIEIPKLPKKSDGTALWDFMKVLDAETEEEMENAAKRNPDVRKTVAIVRELSADERMRAYAEAREKARRDEVASLAYAKTEGIEIGEKRGIAIGERRGIEKGKTEGIEIGKTEGIEQTMKAVSALREGKSIEETARISGLGIDTVRALANG